MYTEKFSRELRCEPEFFPETGSIVVGAIIFHLDPHPGPLIYRTQSRSMIGA